MRLDPLAKVQSATVRVVSLLVLAGASEGMIELINVTCRSVARQHLETNETMTVEMGGYITPVYL